MSTCTSDPTSGCDNSELIAAIESANAETNALILAGNVILGNILTTYSECCTSLNSKLQEEIDLLKAINNKL
jgi:hypothetical protein